MSGNPFASTGVTSADIQDIQKRLTDLEAKVARGTNALSKKMAATTDSTSTSTSTLPIVSGVSDVIPPSPSQIDIASIFPKEGGGKRRKNLKKSKKRKNFKKRKNYTKKRSYKK